MVLQNSYIKFDKLSNIFIICVKKLHCASLPVPSYNNVRKTQMLLVKFNSGLKTKGLAADNPRIPANMLPTI